MADLQGTDEEHRRENDLFPPVAMELADVVDRHCQNQEIEDDVWNGRPIHAGTGRCTTTRLDGEVPNFCDGTASQRKAKELRQSASTSSCASLTHAADSPAQNQDEEHVDHFSDCRHGEDPRVEEEDGQFDKGDLHDPSQRPGKVGPVNVVPPVLGHGPDMMAHAKVEDYKAQVNFGFSAGGLGMARTDHEHGHQPRRQYLR